MLFNPIIALLYDALLRRWHPILFIEAPLPGPPAPGKPVRHRSKGHTTVGFATRAEALASAVTLAANPVLGGRARFAVQEDMMWDGTDVPAMNVFFVDGELTRELTPARIAELTVGAPAVEPTEPTPTRHRTFRFE